MNTDNYNNRTRVIGHSLFTSSLQKVIVLLLKKYYTDAGLLKSDTER